MHLLLIEDDEPLLQAMETKFTSEGYTCVCCVNGEEAMEELGKTSFDAIILDLILPKKDGFAVLEEIKKTKNAATPVYVVTNLGLDEHCDHARSLGAKACFVKSRITLKDVVRAISGELNGK